MAHSPRRIEFHQGGEGMATAKERMMAGAGGLTLLHLHRRRERRREGGRERWRARRKEERREEGSGARL